MKKYKIELNYDIYFWGKFQENESISQECYARTKKEAIEEALLKNKIALQLTNQLFGTFGIMELKNIKAKYKNKLIDVEKIRENDIGQI